MLSSNKIELRLFQESTWEDLKSIRLEGLQTYPTLMGQPFTEAKAMTDQQWLAWVQDPNRGYFGIYDDKKVVGFYFVRIYNENRTEAVLNGLYLKREYQRKGIDRLLFETAIKWAKSKNCSSLEANCKETNYAVKRLFERHGGQFVRKSDDTDLFGDGSRGYSLFYKLDLK